MLVAAERFADIVVLERVFVVAMGTSRVEVVQVRQMHVVKTSRGWAGKAAGGKVVARARKKALAVSRTARVAKASPSAVSVKIHKMNGRIQEERTYPRGADPRRRRG